MFVRSLTNGRPAHQTRKAHVQSLTGRQMALVLASACLYFVGAPALAAALGHPEHGDLNTLWFAAMAVLCVAGTRFTTQIFIVPLPLRAQRMALWVLAAIAIAATVMRDRQVTAAWATCQATYTKSHSRDDSLDVGDSVPDATLHMPGWRGGNGPKLMTCRRLGGP